MCLAYCNYSQYRSYKTVMELKVLAVEVRSRQFD